jgi:uncharacterized protein DUF3943
MRTPARKTVLLLAALAAGIGPRAGAAAEGGEGARTATSATSAAKGALAFVPPASAPPETPARRAIAAPPRDGLLAPGRVPLPLAETLATTLVMIEWNRRVGAAPWANVSLDSIGHNLRSGWELDHDDFWVNQFAHPYQGTFSFTAARSSGFGFWSSVPFTFGASALWEIAGETTLPSVNDQITTTVAGVVFGEIVYRFAGALRADGGPWSGAIATVLAPMAALNGEILGTSQALPAPPSRWQLSLGGAEFSSPAPGARAGPLGYGALSFTYGVPGREALELNRPFDHFVLEAAWTAARDPIATVRARGTLVAATFASARAQGLYGAFLSFDFDTPPVQRISTAALGFGASARADLRGGVALEGDAIASAVLLAAGGTVPASADGPDRNYRFGPGEQSLLALRLLAGDRATLGLSLRQYLFLGVDAQAGTELLLQGTASFTVRVAGATGVGIEVNRYVRRAGVDGVTLRQSEDGVRLYLAILGGT